MGVKSSGLHAFVDQRESAEDVLELGDGEVVKAGDAGIDLGAKGGAILRIGPALRTFALVK